MGIPLGAILRTGFYLLNPKTWQILNQLTGELIKDHQSYNWEPYRKTVVMTVGFSGSGKSTLISANQDLCRFFRIQSNIIHDRLNEKFTFLQDDKTTTGPGFLPRQILTRIVRIKILKEVCRKGIPLVLDSCNLQRSERQSRLRLPKKSGYRIIMIHVDCPESELLHRIEKREILNETVGMPRTWLSLYQDIQLPLFDRPTVNEADQLIHFWSGQQRPSEVSAWISWIKEG